MIGFDAGLHLDYIRYVQEHWAVPLANQGLEMYQPPLYYGISAIALEVFGLPVKDQSGTLLRMLGMFFGIANFSLVFLSLRLLVPKRIGAQLVGLLLAAFVPMQLYLSHYTTNETLAATLATATIYLSLRLFRTEKGSMAQYAGLGLCLGAGILTKVTDVLLAPFVIIALAQPLVAKRASLRMWLRTIGVTLAVCCAVCGWFYIRVWIHFGAPLVGAWDVASGFAWWQDPGYHTVGDYTRFGRSMTYPLFSGFGGFWDGIYSTLWGDGLCGAGGDLMIRPPWNYHLIVAGYLLALVPTAMLLCGAVAAIRRFLAKPSSDQFVPLAFFGAVAFGLLFMSLKVPVYGQVKAFYGLGALLTLCLFGAMGWEVLTRGRKSLQFALGTVLIVWAMNSFASMWIRNGTAARHILQGVGLAHQSKTNAAILEFDAAVKAEPANAEAIRMWAMTLNRFDRASDALENARRAVELSPTEPRSHLQLGAVLARQGQMGQAIAEGKRAVELGPEYALAYQSLTTWLFESGRKEAAIGAARAGLAVSPFDPNLHYALGLSLETKGDLAEATQQLRYAVLLGSLWPDAHWGMGMILLQTGEATNGLRELEEAVRLAPDAPVLLNEVAWVLATFPNASVRNGREAVRLAGHACALVGDNNPKLLGTLAAAYAEAGRFPDAINAAQHALFLARSSGDAYLTTLNQEMLQLFESNRPYRQKPPHLR